MQRFLLALNAKSKNSGLVFSGDQLCSTQAGPRKGVVDDRS